MSEKVEGTIILDGLIQGKIPVLPGSEQKLRDWERFAQASKLIFNLEINGGTFGFLADQAPIAVSHLGHDPAETISGALGELLKIFPPGERPAVFSTLRSVEYRKAEEVQTLYVVSPDGSILARGRTVAADTRAAAAPPMLRDRAMRIAIGAVLLLAVLFVSSFFVNYRGMFAGLRNQLRPLDAPHFPVDAAAFEPYFTVQAKASARDGQGLLLTLHRQPGFLNPETLPSSRPATAQSETEASRFIGAAIAIGYIRCEFYDENRQFMGYYFVRIKPLRDAETMELPIPFSTDRRPSAITLTY